MSLCELMGDVTLFTGDCREVLATLPSDSIDSCVTDPPYHLTTGKKGGSGEASVNLNTPQGRARITTGFMGKKWDGGDVAMRSETWGAVLRVLKPGAYLLAFGGTRTHHRLMCAIEDAGFDIRDCLGWLYGSGFPKSHNLDGDHQGWGTALKPAWEPIIMARKPLIGTVAVNVSEHGTGALNIDKCRVATDAAVDDPRLSGAGSWATDKAAKNVYEGGYVGKAIASSPLGRWPANLIHDGSDEVLAVFPDSAGQLADASSSSSRKTQNVWGAMKRGNGRAGEPSADSANVGDVGFNMKPGARRGDSGSAARFFYCAKASKADRGEGNTHPTVKPLSLMRYLVRLVTPAGGLVLDPFIGSGSTGCAALAENFSFIGCDLESQYVDIARARLMRAYTNS